MPPQIHPPLFAVGDKVQITRTPLSGTGEVVGRYVQFPFWMYEVKTGTGIYDISDVYLKKLEGDRPT